jgi:pyruvate/2-oxoglutarate dehydrogenase complex dihydrolipoamide dehydrogenase (E3) component
LSRRTRSQSARTEPRFKRAAPEVTHIGLTEAQARQKPGDEVHICHWPMERVDRAREHDTVDLIKIVHKQDGTILSTTIVLVSGTSGKQPSRKLGSFLEGPLLGWSENVSAWVRIS